jgi:geranylgeranylglycerol-phosphate geranylgeranyltransferase
MAGVGTFIGYAISQGAIAFPLEAFYLMAAAFLVCGGGQTINDFFDRSIDQKINPKKPIPSGRIKPRPAFTYSIFLFFAGTAFAYLANETAFYIALAFSILLFLYSYAFRKVKYLGNFIVAFGTGFTLIFGASLTGNYLAVSILALAAIAANLARELLKDLEQAKQDKGFKVTLPQKISPRNCLYFVFFYYLVAILASYVPAIMGFFMVELAGFNRFPYLILISAANVVFIYSFKNGINKDFKKAQKFSKIGMVVALIAFLSSIIG